MIFAEELTFQELVTRYQLTWADQAKLTTILLSDQRPPSNPPEYWNNTYGGTFWSDILCLWKRCADRVNSTNQACSKERSSGRDDAPRWDTGSRPSARPASELEIISPQASIPAQILGDLLDKEFAQRVADLRKAFDVEKPPFAVISKRGNTQGTVDLPAATGLRSDNPIKTKIVYRKWDEKKWIGFWTLDRDGIRHIVKAFRGAPNGGWQYKRWLGRRNQIDQWEGPMAFSEYDPKRKRVSSAVEQEEHQEPLLRGSRTRGVADHSGESEETLRPTQESRRPSTKSARRMQLRSSNDSSHTQGKERLPTVNLLQVNRPGSQDPNLHHGPDIKFRDDKSEPISRYKQENTTMRFHMNSSKRFVCEQLGTCSSIADFFACVTKNFHITPENIADALVVFTWMDKDADDREMTMRPGETIDMKSLLNEIEYAPLWRDEREVGGVRSWVKEQGHCTINVYITSR